MVLPSSLTPWAPSMKIAVPVLEMRLPATTNDPDAARSWLVLIPWPNPSMSLPLIVLAPIQAPPDSAMPALTPLPRRMLLATMILLRSPLVVSTTTPALAAMISRPSTVTSLARTVTAIPVEMIEVSPAPPGVRPPDTAETPACAPRMVRLLSTSSASYQSPAVAVSVAPTSARSIAASKRANEFGTPPSPARSSTPMLWLTVRLIELPAPLSM